MRFKGLEKFLRLVKMTLWFLWKAFQTPTEVELTSLESSIMFWGEFSLVNSLQVNSHRFIWNLGFFEKPSRAFSACFHTQRLVSTMKNILGFKKTQMLTFFVLCFIFLVSKPFFGKSSTYERPLKNDWNQKALGFC